MSDKTPTAGTIKLPKSGRTWWRKPLALVDGRLIPAELAILAASLKPGEQGAWLNSRSRRSGVHDLEHQGLNGSFKTKRIPLPLPDFVQPLLDSVYASTGLARGCPDLVIWDSATKSIRLIEVKCPHWDRPSKDQDTFIDGAKRLGIETTIVEWEFV